MGYSHQNSKGKTYFLHSKDVVLKGGRNQTIYYFAKEAKAGACDLPAGKTVVENTKTRLQASASHRLLEEVNNLQSQASKADSEIHRIA